MASLFKINGHDYPVPSNLEPIISTIVDAGRNVNGVTVGQKIGRDQYKLNGLTWNMLTAYYWSRILEECNNFTMDITFWNMETMEWETRTMYCGDRTAKYPEGEMWYNADGSPKIMLSCKVNLIDTGR